MRYLVRLDGTNLRREKSGHRHGLSIEGHELDFVGLAVLVNVYYGSDVAGHEAFAGNVSRQNDSIMFSDHLVP